MRVKLYFFLKERTLITNFKIIFFVLKKKVSDAVEQFECLAEVVYN